MKQYTATANDEGVRLSRFVQSVTRDFPTSLLYKSFRNKRIKVNGKKGAPEDRIKAGDLIELYINDEFFPPEGAKPAHKPAPKKQQNQPKVTVCGSIIVQKKMQQESSRIKWAVLDSACKKRYSLGSRGKALTKNATMVTRERFLQWQFWFPAALATLAATPALNC